jgi:mono/diheme cytochrome c family protein/glucose/arabinose dehydrogenase
MHKQIISVLALLTVPLLAQLGNRKGHDNMEPVVPKELVPPAPVLSVEDSMKSFQIAEGFAIAPFAAEPMIEKPVALDYDPAGRLWVCEMIGYMLDIDGKDEDKPHGRIVVLEDTDQDGKADKRTVFMDKVLLPRALAVYPDGLLFADQESLRFVKRDGLKPVGEPIVAVKDYIQGGNVEHRANGLVRGLDNWLYSAKSSQRIRRDGEKWIVENTPFRGQWGVAFDHFGRIYTNNNSQFLVGETIAPNLLEGNTALDTKTSSAVRLGSNKPFPVRVTPGVNRAYIQKSNSYGENTLDPESFKLLTCTGAAGLTIYRGSNFPSEWVGQSLITESSINLVKAIKVTESNGTLKAEHTYKDKEWLASSDERFRPVNIYNAPDGSVHLLDFYHGIIQHKTYVTSYLRDYYTAQKLDGPGKGHGRIYRITAKGGKVEKVPDMDSLSGEELVKLLSHPNGWHREMAQRVLIDRNDTSVGTLLEQTIMASANPLAQIHALWTLEGLGKLSAAHVTTALNAQDAKVVVSALWVASKLPANEIATAGTALIALDPKTPEQSVYLARALGPIATPAAFVRLNELVNSSKDKFVTAAAFSGLDHREAAFNAAIGDKPIDKTLAGWIAKAGQKKKGSSGSSLKGEALASFERGKALYHGEAACFGCHAPDGGGMVGLAPPLDSSEWVTGKPELLGKVLLHGMTGPITVKGVKYETPAGMPALAGNPMFTDEKIADIMTYVRNEWENKAAPVQPALVTKLRAETSSQFGRPYTEKNLR